MYLIAQDNRLWIWPEASYINLVYAILIIAVGFIGYLIVNIFFMAGKTKERNWSVIEAFARRNKLSGKEIKILKIFFEQLPVTSQESLDFAFEKAEFKNQLHRFLLKFPDLDAEWKVRIIDKLFPRKDHLIEIKSLYDLYEGENCGLEVNDIHYLVRIVKKTQKELLLSATEWIPDAKLVNQAVKLYAYRPDIGGFLLSGTIRAIVKSGMIFTHDGKVEQKGDSHLMTVMEIPVELSSWTMKREKIVIEKEEKPVIKKALPQEQEFIDLDEIEENKPVEENVPDEPDEKIIESRVDVKLDAITDRISDRALLFSISRGMPSELWKHEVWELKMVLPGDREFKCRGNIIKTSSSNKYIFKYIDATGEMQKNLFQMIKENNPVRERLL